MGFADTSRQIKENFKANLTVASKGSSGGEGPRTHVQGTHFLTLPSVEPA